MNYKIIDTSYGGYDMATTLRGAKDSARRMLGVSRMHVRADSGDGIYCFGTLKECREFEEGDAVVIRVCYEEDEEDDEDDDY